MNTIIERYPEINYVLVNRGTAWQPWVAAWNYNEEDGSWGNGHYFCSIIEAVMYIKKLRDEQHDRELEEKSDWIQSEIGYLPVDEEKGINFYYRAMHDHDMGITDADDYCWLNTLFQYDIGDENALQIINWYYDRRDMTVQDAVGVNEKEELKGVCEELGLNLWFDSFRTEEPKAFEIY